MNLRLRGIVKEDKGKYANDQRRVVNYTLASYVGDDGHEYRKSFASYSVPVVPDNGTHQSLNAMKEQF